MKTTQPTKESKINLLHLFFHEHSLVPDVYRVIHQILSYKSPNVPIFGMDKVALQWKSGIVDNRK